ncbi:MAG: ATP-binding cassette domain-containing protein [Bdellovibrionaceae bacterium]|nr:ATP-binding cassette domain-containing protein [Pseudobdellovibrionaceae bacterium]
MKFLKFIFFQNVSPLIKLGRTKNLEAQDLFELPPAFAPDIRSVDEDRVDWSSWSKLAWTLARESRAFWIPAYVLITLCALASLLSPILVYEFVRTIEAGMPNFELTVAYGLGIGLAGLASGLLVQHYFARTLGLYQVLTNTINRKLFRHSLGLRKSARDNLPVGDIVNHMSSDSDSVANMGSVIGDVVYNIVLLTGFVVLLFHYLGAAAWAGLAVLALLIPMTKRTGKLFSELDEKLMKKRDARTTLMSQILSSIRVVKYFTWEKSVSREVQALRHEELRLRGKLARAEMGSTLVYVGVGTLVLFVVLGTHVLLGGKLEPALVFVAVSLFRLVEDPFAMFSRIIAMLANARVAARRISSFVDQPQRQEKRRALDAQSAVAIEVRGLGLQYAGVRALKDVNFQIRRGENFAIVGPVGSGKTSVLNALLGEVDFEGDIAIAAARASEQRGEQTVSAPRGATALAPGSATAYVPQEAYIINSTIRENLSFGRTDVREDEWARALWASCLEEDLEFMRSGLDTEIGERGVNLSGGQKQRISLARSVLQNPEIIFLDDPLSAVDPRTETQLVERLIEGAWRERTRVTVTHRLEHLDRFDRILFLEQGEVKGLGSARELRATCPEFVAFLKEHEAAAHAESLAREEAAKQEAEAPKKAGDGSWTVARVTEDEDREQGAVGGSVYYQYIQTLGGADPKRRPFIWAALLGLAIAATAMPLVQKTWLAWVSNAQSGEGLPSVLEGLRGLFASPITAVLVYGALGVLTLGGVLWSDLYWLERGLKAGRELHDRMLKAILRAQIRFFDATPVGRILQRFSRDLEAVDIELQWSFENSVKSLVQVLVNLVLIVSVLPLVIVFLVPVFAVYHGIQSAYRASAREVKRLDSVSRSPRYAHYKETLQGLVVLRSLGREDWFFREFAQRLANNQRMFYGHYMVNRWFSSRIPVVGALVAMVTTTLICFAVRQGQMTAGVAGLLTVSSLGFWGVLNWGIRIWAEVEARMTSVERIRSFIAVAPEGHAHEATLRRVAEWPQAGKVEFVDVKLRYAEHLPVVLNGLSFEIQAGERVGLIGRTGSGKSTVFQALYRFIELMEGEIRIDGVNIAKIPLRQLRRALAIIPQDPTLFLGTLRTNLDRFGKFTDDEIWRVLEKVRLADFVRGLPQGLASEVVENGANLSQGQRQLICLARALLLRARILILDEATASVDVRTDALVQGVIREACATADGGPMTMIVIAHRLGTVKDCDQILELAHGRLKRRLVPTKRAESEAQIQTPTQEKRETPTRDHHSRV